MSNKTQLSNNNDKLASLIQELANKAAGGGSGAVETCTVRVETAGWISAIMYTAYENGAYIPKMIKMNYMTSNPSENRISFDVVKGQAIFLMMSDYEGLAEADNTEVIFASSDDMLDAYIVGIRITGDTGVISEP